MVRYFSIVFTVQGCPGSEPATVYGSIYPVFATSEFRTGLTSGEINKGQREGDQMKPSTSGMPFRYLNKRMRRHGEVWLFFSWNYYLT